MRLPRGGLIAALAAGFLSVPLAPEAEELPRTLEVERVFPTIDRYTAPPIIADLNARLPNGNELGPEAEATAEAALRLPLHFEQNRSDGVVTISVAGAAGMLSQGDPAVHGYFTEVSRAVAPRAARPGRAGPPILTPDPDRGSVRFTSRDDFVLTFVPAPADVRDFVRIWGEAMGVVSIALQPTGGHLLLTTADAALQLSMRPAFLSLPSPGSPPGLLANADGSKTIVYATGRRQQLFPLALDQLDLAELLRSVPGVSAIRGTSEGDMVVTKDGQEIQLHSEWEVTESPVGTKRGITMDGAGAFVVNFRNGRRQRFLILR